MTRHPTHAQLAHQHSLEWLQEREDAQTEPCPDCHAPTGTACTNPITGLPLGRAPAHHGRIRARATTARRRSEQRHRQGGRLTTAA